MKEKGLGTTAVERICSVVFDFEMKDIKDEHSQAAVLMFYCRWMK